MKIKESNITLFILLFLLFIPTSSKVGGYYFWFFVLNSVLLFLIYKKSTSGAVGYFHENTSILYIIASSCLLGISIVFESVIDARDFNEFVRFFTYLLMYMCVYIYAPKSIQEFNDCLFLLLKILKFFLIAELIVILIQSNDFILNILDYIWNMEKYWSKRRIGTCDNPNTLSILTTTLYSFIYFFENKNRKKIFYLLVSLTIILFSGSRTGLISFMLVLLVNYLLSNNITIKRIIFICFTGSIFLYIFYFLLTQNASFAYMAEILNLFEKSDTSDGVRTLDFRYNLWEKLFNLFKKSSFERIIFGIGPSKGTVFWIIDNDYLTIFIKTGILGSILNLLFFIGNGIYFFINRQYIFTKVMISLTILFLISAYTGATFTSWYLAQFFFYFYAFAYKELQLKKYDNRNNSDIQT